MPLIRDVAVPFWSKLEYLLLNCYFYSMFKVSVWFQSWYSSPGKVLWSTTLRSSLHPYTVCGWLSALTASPPSPLRWGSSAHWDSGPAGAAVPRTRRGWSPSDLWVGFCDSWSGRRTAPTGWWDRRDSRVWQRQEKVGSVLASALQFMSHCTSTQGWAIINPEVLLK